VLTDKLTNCAVKAVGLTSPPEELKYTEVYSLHDYNQSRCYFRWDRCHTCNFIARFCCATLSRDKLHVHVTLRVAQLYNSRATPSPNRAVYD